MLITRVEVERGHSYEVASDPDGTVLRVSVLVRPRGAGGLQPRTTWELGSGKPVPASAALAIETWRKQVATERQEAAAADPPRP